MFFNFIFHMINTIRNFMERLSNSHPSQDFKGILFSNFFGNFQESFQNEAHVAFTADLCFETLCNYKSEDVLIDVKKTDYNSTAYCLIMEDRPFITDSVLNFIHNESLFPSIFIHPNFYFNQHTKTASLEKQENFKRYSIVYFEVKEELTEEQMQALQNVLKEVCNAVSSSFLYVRVS